MAPKKISLHVTYNNQSKPFICEQREVAKVISSHFNINLNDCTMYVINKGERHTVSLKEITDLMKIEIVSKTNEQKTLRTSMELTKLVDNIVSKLKQNTPFTGQERKLMIEGFETHSISFFFKRKLEHTDIDRPVVSHKKLQVNIPADNKDSFCQTEPHYIPSDIENPINDEEDAIQKMKRLWSQEDVPKEQIELLMHETYADRRNFITMQCPPVTVVKERYPALFCVEQVRNELDRIFYRGKCKDFLNNMNIYTKHILHYKESKIEDILEITEKARSRSRTPKQKAYAEVVGSIFVLANLLDENFGFIHLNDHPIHGKENAYPSIDASCYKLQDTFSDEIPYRIIVEGQHLCQASNFCEAILCFVASFFIFNIDYPKNCCRTLIAFEKLYLAADETLDMDEWTYKIIEFYKKQAIDAKKKVVTP